MFELFDFERSTKHFSRTENHRDNSGIFLHYTERQLDKLAGVILLGTGGSIPPKTTEHMETSCWIKERKTIHPFAYRTHTHGLGTVVAGYRVRKDGGDVYNWTLLGKRNPQTPQMFYPALNTETIGFGDQLVSDAEWWMVHFYK